jgi:hypothetical protein
MQLDDNNPNDTNYIDPLGVPEEEAARQGETDPTFVVPPTAPKTAQEIVDSYPRFRLPFMVSNPSEQSYVCGRALELSEKAALALEGNLAFAKAVDMMATASLWNRLQSLSALVHEAARSGSSGGLPRVEEIATLRKSFRPLWRREVVVPGGDGMPAFEFSYVPCMDAIWRILQDDSVVALLPDRPVAPEGVQTYRDFLTGDWYLSLANNPLVPKDKQLVVIRLGIDGTYAGNISLANRPFHPIYLTVVLRGGEDLGDRNTVLAGLVPLLDRASLGVREKDHAVVLQQEILHRCLRIFLSSLKAVQSKAGVRITHSRLNNSTITVFPLLGICCCDHLEGAALTLVLATACRRCLARVGALRGVTSGMTLCFLHLFVRSGTLSLSFQDRLCVALALLITTRGRLQTVTSTIFAFCGVPLKELSDLILTSKFHRITCITSRWALAYISGSCS